ETASWEPSLRDCLRLRVFDLLVPVAFAGSAVVVDFFEWLRKNPIGVPALAVLPPDDELMRAAAAAVDDFIVTPLRPGELHQRIARLIGGGTDQCIKAAAHENLTRELALKGLVGRHPAFVRTIEQLPLMAGNNSPILITGETGTGKEL